MGRAAAQEVTDALLAASRNRALAPTVQRDAGFSLGRSGWQPDDLDAFILIPAGPFLYGEEKRTVVIEKPFEIAKYPVTNLQYRRFVEDDGYNQREFWSDDGWRWRTGAYQSQAQEEWFEEWLAERSPDKRAVPFIWSEVKWNNPLAPVVCVNWFEAEAYCNWLNRKDGRLVHLPTEEEWERAARHIDGREYPWGDKFGRNRLNTAEFWDKRDDLDWYEWLEDKGYEVASTTIVGQFPEGNSQSGAADVSGNVWEWTDSWFDNEKNYRVIRGGAWNFPREDAHCVDRLRFTSDFFMLYIGFRVVRSP